MHAAGKVLGPYVFGKNLGQGTFGKVKMATHQLTQEPVSACVTVGRDKNTREGSHKGKKRH